jgi:hypothetical protein
MNFEREIHYINLDDLQLVLRLTHGSKHTIPMIIFDTGQMQGWRVGDRIDSNPGAMSMHREIQKKMGMKMSEEDYILTNQRTGGQAVIRKNDYECEDAHAWLAELKKKGLAK